MAMLIEAKMMQCTLTGLVALQPGSDLPELNEVLAHGHDALAQFAAVCSYSHTHHLSAATSRKLNIYK